MLCISLFLAGRMRITWNNLAHTVNIHLKPVVQQHQQLQLEPTKYQAWWLCNHIVPFKYNTPTMNTPTAYRAPNDKSSEDSAFNKCWVTSQKTFVFSKYHLLCNKTQNKGVKCVSITTTAAKYSCQMLVSKLVVICLSNQNSLSCVYAAKFYLKFALVDRANETTFTCLFVRRNTATGARVCKQTDKALTTTKRACGTEWQTLTSPVLWWHHKGSERRTSHDSHITTRFSPSEYPTAIRHQAGIHCHVTNSLT